MIVVAGSADAHLIEKWDSNLKACQQQRLTFEKQWHENMSFYFGRQWITTSKSQNGGFSMSEMPPTDSWRVRHTANRILRIIRTEVTKLTKEEPQFFCVPDSTEESDRLAAMAGDSIAEYLLKTKHFNRRRLEATFWACICGSGFIKNYYDPNKLEQDGQPGKIDFEAVTTFHTFVPNLQCTEIEDEPYMIHARTLNPEDVYTTYGVELEAGTDSSSTVIDSRFLSSIGIKQSKQQATKQCYVKEVYVKPCKDFPNGSMFVYGEGKILYVFEAPEIPEGLPGGMPEQMAGDMGAQMGGPPSIEGIMAQLQGGGGMDPMPPQMPQRPPVGFPGMPPTESPTLTDSADITAPKSDEEGMKSYNHEFPYRHGHFPFVKIDHIPTGMFYGESVIKSLIGPQKEYNKTRSIMLESRNLAGKPQWWYTAGAFDTRKWNAKPGLLLAVQMGFDPPKPLEQPELSPSVSNDLDIVVRDMDDISSQYEVSKGRTPPGVEAASAIAYLSEENDTILYHTVQSIENAVQETGVQVLANVHDYWPEDRIVRMTSKNQAMEVREFKATDLNPRMDFRVESGSMAPRSVAAKQAFITELMKMGAIEPTKALRYLQMSETDKMYDELMLDARQAQRENVSMSHGQPLYKPDTTTQQQIDPTTGMPTPSYKTDVMRDPMTGEPQIDPATGQPQTYNVTVNPYDAHETHVEEHEAYQKSQEYEFLTPDIQAIIQQHVDEHKMELLKERNAAQADDIAKQGTSETQSPRTAPDQAPPPPDQGSTESGPSGN